ncbi:uncharacterized protein [Paramormyrops kingsleyae]|uniref:uncharacterized protein isoform X2 n=1 Tax=Paramormyrops kingsleyae TaxID=1676925 RepID=UPI003B96C3D3
MLMFVTDLIITKNIIFSPFFQVYVCKDDRKEQYFNVEIAACVCDTPARAFVKNIKSHNGCLETEEEEERLRRTSRVPTRYQTVSSEEDELDQGQRVRTSPVPVLEKRPSTTTKRIGDHSVENEQSISSASTSTGFELTAIRILMELSVEVKELRQRLDHNTALLNDLVREKEADVSVYLKEDPISADLQLDLPLTLPEDLQELDLKLEDVDFANKLVLKLAVLGGKDVPSTTRRILANLLAPELAREYNWTGAKGKKEFKNFKINNIILRAVRQNSKTKDTTKDEVKGSITSFLYNARDLKGGRSKRRTAEQESGGPSKQGRVEVD